MKTKKDENIKKKSNAFMAESEKKKSEVICHNCGKAGHYKRECHYNSQSGNNEQWKKAQSARGRGGAVRGNFKRGAWRGRAGFRGNSSSQTSNGYRENQQDYNNASGSSAWVTTMECNMVNSDGEVKRVNNNEINWLLDSGCTDHIVNNENYFENCRVLEKPMNVCLGNNSIVKATKIGTVRSYFNAFGKENEVRINNVYYVKDMHSNLISYGKITNTNTIISKGNLTKIIENNKKVTAVAWKEGNLHRMQSKLKLNTTHVYSTNVNNMSDKEKWHRMLGHVNFDYLNKLIKYKLLDGIPSEIESEFMRCKICIENKMNKLPFENNRYQAKQVLEIIHTDVCGPFQTTGPNGERYFVSFIDDYSKIVKVYPIKTKAEVFDCLVEFINESENLTEKRVKVLRCDNGTEYLNNRIYNFVKEKGITINTCPTYVHELNGTAERFNRTIMNISRCLLSEADVNKKYWPEIVCAAAYLKNRTLSNTIEKKTPYEIFFQRKPKVKHLRLYGSKVFVKIPDEKRESKWDKRAKMGILLGYSEVGYRVLLNDKIIVARHVDIVEPGVKCIGFNDSENEDENEQINDNAQESSKINENDYKNECKQDDVCEKVDVDSNENILRRSNRNRMPNKKYTNDDYVYDYCIQVNYSNVNTPSNFEEAMECDECVLWKRAMDKEIKCIDENKTWKLIDKSKTEGKKILDVKWVYTIKHDNNYKARLVVRGDQQTDTTGDTYSPVAKMQTLKILLSYCCKEGLIIEQMDVQTAFLNGEINTEVYIYIYQPKGYDDRSGRVCKLEKALYGLKESPRKWYECLDSFLLSLGFKKSNLDYCMYTLIEKYCKVYIIIFVDDLLICCKDREKIKQVKNVLFKRFKMKDLGDVKDYIGINIDYDFCKHEMKLNQTKYIESLAKKYKVLDSKPYSTPMEVNLKIDKSDICEKNIQYRNLIGALLYVSSGTRPDISFSVNYLSRYQNCYNESHYKYALRILKYLYSTKNLKLNYKRHENCEIIDCHVDADWAGDSIDRK